VNCAYPASRIEDVVESLAGVSFADPYRWLEKESHEVREWQRAQAELATSHVREWPHVPQLRRLVAQFNTERYVILPRYAAGRWFRLKVADGASQAHALVSDKPMGDDGQILFDPIRENPDRPPFLSWIAPSPDGRTLAVGVCVDGSENNTIRLVDVSTGQQLANPPTHTLMDNWTGGVQWLPDSSGFFFSAITGAAIDFEQRVYLHRRFPVSMTVPIDVAWSAALDYRTALVSSDGRHAVVLERLQNPIPIAIAKLSEHPLQWRPFVTSIEGTVVGQVVGNRYIAVTDVAAPRGRVVAIDLNSDDPNDPDGWQELVAESNATLRTLTLVGEQLYLTEFVDTYTRLRIVDLQGRELGQVPLPDRGTVMELPFPMMNAVPLGHPSKFLFGFSSLTISPGIYSHTASHADIETLQAPKVRLDNALVEDRWAVSADGTRIPYHVVRRADLKVASPLPTLIHAYGGYNVPLVPRFPGPMASVIAFGGAFVHAHIRGGGEFGLGWWQGGRMGNKQNGYNDLYAIAEDLIAANLCAPGLLAVSGGSNGGHMTGVAITQRPDLWAVAVPRVPILDLIGACRDPYGRQAVIEELANVDVADEVYRLATISPYHLVRHGIRYPAVYLDAGATDPRCPPWHARKFAARLQAANTGDAPILLHVWENVGHGWATDEDVAVAEHTEWLAFTLRHLGLGSDAGKTRASG
jgi:prolyl oligopeptidase